MVPTYEKPAAGSGLTALEDQQLGGFLMWVPAGVQLDRRALAALVGVAPFNCDSGTLRGRRCCWGGRAELRGVLYMATVSAAHRNPVIRAFYQRFLKAGKPKQLAFIACMRKLLTLLNAMVRDGTTWNPLLPQTA